MTPKERLVLIRGRVPEVGKGVEEQDTPETLSAMARIYNVYVCAAAAHNSHGRAASHTAAARSVRLPAVCRGPDKAASHPSSHALDAALHCTAAAAAARE